MERAGRGTSLRHRVPGVLRSRPMRLLYGAVAFLVLVWLLRFPLLRGVGSFLITEDPPCKVDAVYVLGGSAELRGREAAAVYRAGWSGRFRFTGAPVPSPLLVEGIHHTEAWQTRAVAVQHGVPDSLALALNVGTSTWEEAGAILADTRLSGFDTVMIVSSRFHLRRIRHVFKERFRKQGVIVVLHGAQSGAYDEARWWENEDGLLMVNNEYVKLVYYLLRY